MASKKKWTGKILNMKILFLCIANSARSQMAEGLARAMFQGAVEVQSAESAPSSTVHPVAIQVMSEVGIDISRQYSKNWNQLPASFLNGLDYLITLCEEECPNIRTQAKRLGWGIKDPAAISGGSDVVQGFRIARDKIRARLEEFEREHDLL